VTDETQTGDGETAVCHVCGQRFATQAELLKHLEDQHPDDLLPDPADQ
jgi:transcription elongation factor Elf1